MKLNKYDIKKYFLVEYLEVKLGIQPDIIRGDKRFYKSPLRTGRAGGEENTASFCIDTSTNTFCDFGDSSGDFKGDIITFHAIYQKERYGKDLNFQQVLGDLHSLMGGFVDQIIASPKKEFKPKELPTRQGGKIRILGNEPGEERYKPQEITNKVLINYIANVRCLPFALVKKYYKQVYYYSYQGQQKPFWALGMPNLSGGFEIRNATDGEKAFKSADIKDLSYFEFENVSGIFAIFEGGFDFVAFLKHYPAHELQGAVILHTAGLWEKAVSLLKGQQVKEAWLYLDDDKAGNNATARLIQELGIAAKDKRDIYRQKNLKDFNELEKILQNQ